MKKIAIIALLLVSVLAIVAMAPQKQSDSDYLRIHIRADSNSDEDQNVKYVVKNAVVQYLAPFLAQATTKSKALQIVEKHLDSIKEVCNSVLRSQGKNYLATVKLCKEDFPDRRYQDLTLSAGVYDALIINLGSGSGNNWWCVVYPPLCFVEGVSGSQGLVFKSKLLQIISEWRQK